MPDLGCGLSLQLMRNHIINHKIQAPIAEAQNRSGSLLADWGRDSRHPGKVLQPQNSFKELVTSADFMLHNIRIVGNSLPSRISNKQSHEVSNKQMKGFYERTLAKKWVSSAYRCLNQVKPSSIKLNSTMGNLCYNQKLEPTIESSGLPNLHYSKNDQSGCGQRQKSRRVYEQFWKPLHSINCRQKYSISNSVPFSCEAAAYEKLRSSDPKKVYLHYFQMRKVQQSDCVKHNGKELPKREPSRRASQIAQDKDTIMAKKNQTKRLAPAEGYKSFYKPYVKVKAVTETSAKESEVFDEGVEPWETGTQRGRVW